jgi:16S rRNA (cytidine1402-2'-O)-methyltransferase
MVLMMQDKSEGTLYIVSTPIGNLEDITLRALRVLKEVDLIAAEDTRRTRQLLTHYGIQKPLISYHEHNERMREDRLLEELREGKNVALVTDAGTPGISDPGEPLIRRPSEKIPCSDPGRGGMAAPRIGAHGSFFYGFPAKSPARQKEFEGLRKRPETLIFYESPRRLPAFLKEAREILGDRQVAVAREITKIFEETLRGPLSEVLEQIGEEGVKGEITVILAGNTEQESVDPRAIREALQKCLRAPPPGRTRSSVVAKNWRSRSGRFIGRPKDEKGKERADKNPCLPERTDKTRKQGWRFTFCFVSSSWVCRSR